MLNGQNSRFFFCGSAVERWRRSRQTRRGRATANPEGLRKGAQRLREPRNIATRGKTCRGDRPNNPKKIKQ